MSPLISIHTPSWNRADYLERVWIGLCGQTFQDFEWIVSDDGSTDNTQGVLRKLKKLSTFPMIIVTASARVGKTLLDNHAIKMARGEFFLWNDSDDVLLPTALEVLINAWDSIPFSDRHEFVGITALCETKGKIISSSLPFSGVFDTKWNELRHLHKVQGDMVYFCKTNILRANPFPEVDFVISESSVWDAIGAEFKTRVIPEVVRLIEYGALHCISNSNKMEYCRGKAYAIALTRGRLAKYNYKFFELWWEIITYLRYCKHGEISFRDSLKLWDGNYPLITFLILTPFSLLLVLKDIVQGKVRRTHREFIKAKQIATITISN